MEEAVISYLGADLYAREHDGQWTVRLGGFEASSSYLDLALADVLENDEGVHKLAARLVAELASAGSARTDEPIAA